MGISGHVSSAHPVTLELSTNKAQQAKVTVIGLVYCTLQAEVERRQVDPISITEFSAYPSIVNEAHFSRKITQLVYREVLIVADGIIITINSNQQQNISWRFIMSW